MSGLMKPKTYNHETDKNFFNMENMKTDLFFEQRGNL
jgi:hypothetical protein